ncbi:UNVERIFIED_CONTAM: hypothetical protein GTU68_031915 [Idotea baltica]|nr:hypothetical protein [Idotea baltica]
MARMAAAATRMQSCGLVAAQCWRLIGIWMRLCAPKRLRSRITACCRSLAASEIWIRWQQRRAQSRLTASFWILGFRAFRLIRPSVDSRSCATGHWICVWALPGLRRLMWSTLWTRKTSQMSSSVSARSVRRGGSRGTWCKFACTRRLQRRRSWRMQSRLLLVGGAVPEFTRPH